jgi:PAS domain-containing protein
MAELNDITDQENKKAELLKAEDELITEKHKRQESERLKQKYFEHYYALDKAIIFAEENAEGVFTYVNQQFCRSFGIQRR